MPILDQLAAIPEDAESLVFNRRQLIQATAGLGIFASLTGAAQGQEDLPEQGTPKPEGVPEDIDVEDALEHPEEHMHKPWFIDLLLTLNFGDAVVSLAKTKNAQPVSNRILARAAGVLEAISGKKFSGLKDKVSKFDHHFPHTSIFTGLALNYVRASQGEHQKHEVIHGLEEASMGVGMLLAATSVGAGIRTREEGFLESIHTHDKAVVAEIESEAPSKEPAQRINDALEQIPEVVGAAPFAAALNQVPLLAFGNARIAKDKMLSVNKLSMEIFKSLQGLTAQQAEDVLSQVDNEQVKKFARAVMSNGSLDEEQALSEDHCQTMSDAYMANFGVGMLSGNMDVTQAALGDIGPAVVGATQSFGADQMLSTGLSNYLYAIEMGVIETYHIAQRLGIPTSKLLSGKTMADSMRMFGMCWGQLISYVAGFRGSPKGVRFGAMGQVGDDLGKMFRMGTQAMAHAIQVGTGHSDEVDDILARKGKHELNDARAKRAELTSDIINELPNITGRDAQIRSAMATAGVITLSEAKDATTNVDALLSDDNKRIVAESVSDITTLVAGIDGTPSREQADGILGKIAEFQQALHEIDCHNPEAQKDVHTLLEEVAELFEKRPGLMDLFNIEYWELHLGPEMAETAFVVFLQGIHIVGLTPTLNTITYDRRGDMNSAWESVFGKGNISKAIKGHAGLGGSMLVHAAMSSVADNWADQLIHAKQLSGEVFVPQLAETGGAPELSGKVDRISQNITDQFTQLTILLEEVYGARGESSELDALYEEIYDLFLITKHMTIESAVLGGGESVIGNSPHFSAIVEDLKRMITLGASFKDILTNYKQHLVRFTATYANARYVGPYLEKGIRAAMFGGNPFTPENRGDYTAPSGEHAHHTDKAILLTEVQGAKKHASPYSAHTGSPEQRVIGEFCSQFPEKDGEQRLACTARAAVSEAVRIQREYEDENGHTGLRRMLTNVFGNNLATDPECKIRYQCFLQNAQLASNINIFLRNRGSEHYSDEVGSMDFTSGQFTQMCMQQWSTVA